MRKYYRLFLFLTTLISLILFLVYRHQYNRLHYVLEVFDFFGHPCNFSSLENEKLFEHHDWGPKPLWQDSEKIHLYSAFWTNQMEVKAIAVVPADNAHARNCFLWYENRRKPTLGKFKFSPISESSAKEFKPFFYYCGTNSKNHSIDVPYAVSFSAKSKLVDPKKILLTNNLDYHVNLNITLCVPPSAFSKTKFIEFLSFHKLVGVNSFIFYGGAVPYRISKLISNLAYSLDIYVAFYPWNFPYSYKQLGREIIAVDCILRSKNQSYYAAVLEMDEYVVPEQYNSLIEILDNIDHDAQKVSFPVIKFCLEEGNPNKPMVLQSTELMDTKELNVANFYRVNLQNNTVSVHNFDRGFAAVHKYVHCTTDKVTKRSVNTSILKYSTDFIRTTLMQMLKSNVL